MDHNFFKELFKNEPAKITAESDDKGVMNIMIEGRGIELLALAFEISEHVIEKSPITIDDYCKMLKDGAELRKNRGKSKEQLDVERIIIDKMLKDIFK